MSDRTEDEIRADAAALDREIARRREALHLALRGDIDIARAALDAAPKRRPYFPDVPETFVSGPAARAPRPASLDSTRTAERWSLFAAHALQGLLAGNGDAVGLNLARRAAELADGLLEEHGSRFATSQPAPNAAEARPRSPAPPPGAASPPRAATRPPR